MNKLILNWTLFVASTILAFTTGILAWGVIPGGVNIFFKIVFSLSIVAAIDGFFSTNVVKAFAKIRNGQYKRPYQLTVILITFGLGLLSVVSSNLATGTLSFSDNSTDSPIKQPPTKSLLDADIVSIRKTLYAKKEYPKTKRAIMGISDVPLRKHLLYRYGFKGGKRNEFCAKESVAQGIKRQIASVRYSEANKIKSLQKSLNTLQDKRLTEIKAKSSSAKAYFGLLSDKEKLRASKAKAFSLTLKNINWLLFVVILFTAYLLSEFKDEPIKPIWGLVVSIGIASINTFISSIEWMLSTIGIDIDINGDGRIGFKTTKPQHINATVNGFIRNSKKRNTQQTPPYNDNVAPQKPEHIKIDVAQDVAPSDNVVADTKNQSATRAQQGSATGRNNTATPQRNMAQHVRNMIAQQ